MTRAPRRPRDSRRRRPRRVRRLGRGDRRAHHARPHRLVRRLTRENDDADCASSSRAARSSGSTPSGARTASSPAATPSDVARVEARTFICSDERRRRRPHQQLARPGRDARDPARALRTAACAAARCTSCRSRWARSAARSRSSACRSPTRPTSSLSMGIMTRMGDDALELITPGTEWVPAVHSVGAPARRRARPTCAWPCNDDEVHRALPRDPRDLVVRLRLRRQRPPRPRRLRAAHRLGHRPRRGLARRAHAAPQGHQPARPRVPRRRGVPVGVRQDQPRDAAPDDPRLEGRDHRRRHRLAAPRRGRHACGRSTPRPASSASPPAPAQTTNATAVETLWGNTIFTNVALRDDGDVWWEGLTDKAARPPHRLGGQRTGRRTSGRPAAHPNSRFTVAAAQCPSIADDWDDPRGRASSTRSSSAAAAPPTCRWWSEARDWEHGVFMGATISSERTAAAEGTVGELRRDPFAMLPFCGYNMADHWAHWLEVGREAAQAGAAAARSSR